MGEAFQSHAKYYDLIYSDKDYVKECDFLEKLIRNYATFSPKTILDGGCGTGGHAIPLAKKGYEIFGVDSSKEMIEIANEKTKRSRFRIEFRVMNLRELKLDKKFDACICMFAVISYLINTKDLLRVFSNIREHLRNGSLFIFDFWYGPAVLTTHPEQRMKIVENNEEKVVRFAEPHLDTLRQTCEVDYYFLVSKGNKVIHEGKEKHNVRFYFPEEIKHLLEDTGFKLLRLCPFLDLDAEPDEKNWNVTAIAQAI